MLCFVYRAFCGTARRAVMILPMQCVRAPRREGEGNSCSCTLAATHAHFTMCGGNAVLWCRLNRPPHFSDSSGFLVDQVHCSCGVRPFGPRALVCVIRMIVVCIERASCHWMVLVRQLPDPCLQAHACLAPGLNIMHSAFGSKEAAPQPACRMASGLPSLASRGRQSACSVLYPS